MRSFRRRSKLVDALQFDGTAEGRDKLAAFAGRNLADAAREDLHVRTPFGVAIVSQGSWLVRDPATRDLSVVTNDQFFRDHDHVGA